MKINQVPGDCFAPCGKGMVLLGAVEDVSEATILHTLRLRLQQGPREAGLADAEHRGRGRVPDPLVHEEPDRIGRSRGGAFGRV